MSLALSASVRFIWVLDAAAAAIVFVGGADDGTLFLESGSVVTSFLSSEADEEDEESEDESGNDSSEGVGDAIDRCRGAITIIYYLLLEP
jgi:hypothetical protein